MRNKTSVAAKPVAPCRRALASLIALSIAAATPTIASAEAAIFMLGNGAATVPAPRTPAASAERPRPGLPLAAALQAGNARAPNVVPPGLSQGDDGRANAGLATAGWGGSPQASVAGFNAMFQQGDGNNALTRMTASPAAGSATLQLGEGNGAYSIIHASPGSGVAQTQIGSGNAGLVGIIGGRDNRIATAQVGQGLGLAVGLVNSVETEVIYGQAGQNVNGGVVILNAPAGTVIRLN